MQIVDSNGLVIFYDDADHDFLSSFVWVGAGSGINIYAFTTIRTRIGTKINKRSQTMHILLLGKKAGLEIDHINGNGLDNRRCNLRFVTHSQNCANMRNPWGKSKFKGVSWCKADNRWIAKIGLGSGSGKQKHLGTFISEVEAAKAYDKAARERWGEFAATNAIIYPGYDIELH